MDGSAGLGLALALGNDSYFGLFGKTVYQQADTQKAYAYAADLGFIRNYGETVRVGLAIQNFGTPIKLHTESFELPRTYRAGGAYRLMDRAWLTMEIMKAGHSDLAAAAGAEGEYSITRRETVFARAGYKQVPGTPGPFRRWGSSDDIGVDCFRLLATWAHSQVLQRFGGDREALTGKDETLPA